MDAVHHQHRHRHRHAADRRTASTAQSSVTIQAAQSPAIALSKQASITSFSAAGAPVTYAYSVTNTGNVTLDPVTVTDPMPGLSAITCPDTTLAPGAPAIDLHRHLHHHPGRRGSRQHHQHRHRHWHPARPVRAATATSTATIPGVQTPGITLVKSVDASTFSTAGTLLIYSYLVTNTGNVTLANGRRHRPDAGPLHDQLSLYRPGDTRSRGRRRPARPPTPSPRPMSTPVRSPTPAPPPGHHPPARRLPTRPR